MTIEQKNELVKNYIISMCDNINKQYENILPKDKIDRAIEMFSNLEKNYDEIIEDINKLTQQTIDNYLKLFQKGKNSANEQPQQNTDERDSKTFEQIKTTQEKVQRLLDEVGQKIYISGGTVPYLLMNQDSNRLHDDIDTICRLEDMQKLREVFKKAGLYSQEWDSMNYANDGRDYGFETKIDGVPFGIYPFDYQNGVLTQFSYDPYNKQCKIKTLPLLQLSDYIMTYRGTNGNIYNTMSLEFIKMTKDSAGREKDIIDSKKIIETGILRGEVSNRIQMFTEVQRIGANKLEKNFDENEKILIESSKIESKNFLYGKNQIGINQNINKIEQQKKQLLEEKRKITNPEEKPLNIEEQKVLLKTNPNIKMNGYIDSLVLATITGFVSGIIFVIVYNIIK